MTTWQATATFSGTSTFKATGRVRLNAQASFAGAGAVKATGRGKWNMTAHFAGASAVKGIVTRGPWSVTAHFAGGSALRARMVGPLHAMASFHSASYFKFIPSVPGQDFLNMPAATVDIHAFTDADYAMTYQWQPDGLAFDFTNHQLMMMVRRIAEDDEVFLSLNSSTSGVPTGESGIDVYEQYSPGPDNLFDVIISRTSLADIPPGDYVQSLILIRPDGLRYDIWRGAFTLATGPTR